MGRGSTIATVLLCAVAACKYAGRDLGAADASINPPADGAPDGTPVPDGAGDPDAPVVPDAPGPADAALPVTVVFGERPGADFTGVTSDAFIESANPTLNHGADLGIWADASPVTNGLLRFDLSALPPGTAVTAVDLLVTTTLDPLETGTVQIYPVLQSWGEGGATWNERTAGTAWADAGASPPGSRGTTLVGEFTPSAITTPYVVALDLATVQGWIDAPGTNRGMVLISTSPAGNGMMVSSRDEAVATARPALQITYQP